MGIAEFLASGREIVTLLTAVAAFAGVRAWHKDFVGKRQIEMAEDALRMFYHVRDVVRVMRAPFSFGGEDDDVQPMDGETGERFHWRKTVAPLWKRYRERESLFSDLYALKYGFMARFGNDKGQPFDDISRLMSEMFNAANELVRTADYRRHFAGDGPDNQRRRDQQIARQLHCEQLIWEHAEDDEVNQRLESIVKRIEDVCRVTITRPTRWTRFVGRFKVWYYRPLS